MSEGSALLDLLPARSSLPTGAPAEYLSSNPPPIRAEETSLRSLVHHREAIEASVPLENAYAQFQARKVDFMAVIRGQRVIGLCSRGQVGFVLGSRFGFALYSHTPVETALAPLPLIVKVDTPARVVIDHAMARHGEFFREDVVVVDNDERLVGLIQTETLAQLQSRFVTEQLEALRRQHETLQQQHLDLFRATHAARQSQGLYLGLFEAHTLGVALLDTGGGIHEHNRRLAELLGFADGGASLVSLTAWVEARERPAFLELLKAHSQGTATSTREFSLNIPHRGIRTFRCSTGWIKETGQICACLDDITEQRALERSLLRQEKQILLDTLVGGIAHELNNKLTPVQGFAELLELQVSAEAKSHARYIQKSVAEAAHIIRQLFQLSKPSTPSLERVDLRTIVEETVAMLQFQARAARCEIRTTLPASPVWVLGDVGQIKQIALNLTINALHATEHTPDPKINLQVTAQANVAAFAVLDNGCGINPEILGRIFDPFFTTKGPERGSGLGLSVCFSLVRHHGGDIAVKSQVGAGTCFTVSLPIEHNGPEARPALTPMPAVTVSVPGGLRALVVDDDVVVSMVLQEMLRSQFGCLVDAATNGIEALGLIERYEYALVISDIQMPLMKGPELFARVNETKPHLARRFVFVTGYAGGAHLSSKIEQWAVPVIAKPFTLTRLAEVCGPLLRRESGPPHA